MNKLVIGFLLAFLFTGEALNAQSKNGLKNSNGMKDLKLTEVWDKVFPQSNKVEHRKVTFVNRYGITLAADMYIPKGTEGKLPAIAVSGPFGAVKEQVSGLYAQTMAERGFLTIAFDPSFYRGKQWRTALCSFSRYKYGRFLCSSRFSVCM